mmetsp:Transcript_114476/g.199131  ORF Transcript_114476/g.199131 Transcript_114476/m.199131 type:complete len:219 (-) Transcript_114476:360-1016(-)
MAKAMVFAVVSCPASRKSREFASICSSVSFAFVSGSTASFMSVSRLVSAAFSCSDRRQVSFSTSRASLNWLRMPSAFWTAKMIVTGNCTRLVRNCVLHVCAPSAWPTRSWAAACETSQVSPPSRLSRCPNAALPMTSNAICCRDSWMSKRPLRSVMAASISSTSLLAQSDISGMNGWISCLRKAGFVADRRAFQRAPFAQRRFSGGRNGRLTTISRPE